MARCHREGAHSTVDKIAYVASNFVTPAPSFAAAAKILGSQALKGVTDNVNYFRQGSGGCPTPQSGRGHDMRIYAGNRVDDPTNPLYKRGGGILIFIKPSASCLNQRKGGHFRATTTQDRIIPLKNSFLTTPKLERY